MGRALIQAGLPQSFVMNDIKILVHKQKPLKTQTEFV